MGIDPATHKPKTNPLGSSQQKDTANLSHMAQWENARLEAEARLVRESKLLMMSTNNNNNIPYQTKASFLPCLDILKVWQGLTLTTTTKPNNNGCFFASNGSLQSPTSTLNFSENMFVTSTTTSNFGENFSFPMINYVENSKPFEGGNAKENGLKNFTFYGKASDEIIEERMGMEVMDNAMQLDDHIEYPNTVEAAYVADESLRHPSFMEGFGSIVSDNGPYQNLDSSCDGDLEDNKKYWNNILLSNAGSPIF
ncbi:hypothetical protein ACH5RR_035895 [Cinchona calisaya]|uniref:Uncharacterized protein n=1 Tax=Cinchona calisaya TaxID=153742 RepID=A0ABD2Y405_9GENT